MSGFYHKLRLAWQRSESLVCLGLDPDLNRIPDCLRTEPDPVFAFNKAIIDATAEHICACKPQFAHYAGQDRLPSLRRTFEYLRGRYPHIVTILDAKRGDIGSTADYYAKEAFDIYQADAVTVNAYMGGDTLEPFTRFADRGVIILCRTSNPGSGELQELKVGSEPLYQIVARKAATEWNRHQNIALVVGATYPDELAAVRKLTGPMPILVPGIGAQGGDLKAVLQAGLTGNGCGLLINSSRGILYAGNGSDFAEQAATAAQSLQQQIKQASSI